MEEQTLSWTARYPCQVHSVNFSSNPSSFCYDIFLHFFAHNNFGSRRSTMWKLLTLVAFFSFTGKMLVVLSLVCNNAESVFLLWGCYIREKCRCFYLRSDNEMKGIKAASQNAQSLDASSPRLSSFCLIYCFLSFWFSALSISTIFIVLFYRLLSSTKNDDFKWKVKAEIIKTFEMHFFEIFSFIYVTNFADSAGIFTNARMKIDL